MSGPGFFADNTFQEKASQSFSRRNAKNQSKSVFPGACTSEKTLLSLQTCSLALPRVPSCALQQAASPCRQRPLAFVDSLSGPGKIPGRSDCRQSRFLSLRTSDRRHWCGNPYSPKTACSLTFLPENGFPRQCAHWLGMTCFELCLHIETSGFAAGGLAGLVHLAKLPRKARLSFVLRSWVARSTAIRPKVME